jgi:hypothetical protein
MSAETETMRDDAARISTPPRVETASDSPDLRTAARIAHTLAGVAGAVVVGESATATALAAISVARAVARDRVVTLVDLVGDVPPLRVLAIDDDPHGVSDCFEYGISPKAVTRHTHASERLFVIPGGSDALDYDAALASARWGRLVQEYRAAGALLLFVATARTPGLPALLTQTEGAVVVGSADSAIPAGVPILSRTDWPRRRTTRLAPPVKTVPPPSGRLRQIGTGLVAAAGIAAAVLLIRTPVHIGSSTAGTGAASTTSPSSSLSASSAGATASPAAAEVVTSSAQLGPASAPAGSDPAAAAADPYSAPYALRLGTYLRYPDALRALRAVRSGHRAAPITRTDATITPVTGTDGAPRFLLLAGAYHDSTTADSAGADAQVMRTPLALRLDRGVAPETVAVVVDAYVGRGIPAYALLGADGAAVVYAGAFASVGEAAALTASLTAAGLTPVLVARAGHPL